MSSIAYITDSKLLELHRLNNHKTMNFWRLSNKVNFTDFSIGDLVFFLSKDKEHQKNKEKGIVGFGRLKQIHVSSIKLMWDKFGNLNGYNSLEEFKEAILKVSKDKELPNKISSFYLEDVTFFQPIFLSECGMNISTNVESYIYIKPEEVTVEILNRCLDNADLWSPIDHEDIEYEKLLFSLFKSHNQIKNTPLVKKAYKTLREYTENTDYEFMQNSQNELYRINKQEIKIVFYHDKDVDVKQLIGQAKLYRHYMSLNCNQEYNLKFSVNDKDEFVEYILNTEI